MAGTYSKYDGQAYQTLSSKLILSNDGTQSYSFTNNSVYTDLVDNESKLISPNMLRNSILSVWDTSVFKETSLTSSSIYYIGIDSGDNLINRDLKSKIYLGKRFYKGNEIMSSTLLNSEVDVFLYNTKVDTLNQQNLTRVVLLSGTNSSIYNKAPYIGSEYVVGSTQSSLSLNLVNTSYDGDINLLSRGIDPFTGLDTSSGGTVSINGIGFPTYQSSTQYEFDSGLNSKILTWFDGGLTWSTIEIDNTNYVGTTGSELNIYGDPVNVNDWTIELSDNRRVPVQVGSVVPGTTFSKNSLSDVLNRIVYTYLSPTCNLSLNTNEYLEVGTSPDIKLDYTINKKVNNLLPTLLTNMIPSSYQAINSPFSETVTGRVSGVVITPIQATTSTFTIKVDDGVTSNSVSKSVTGVYPYFYGFSTQSSISNQDLTNLTKKIEPLSDKEYDIFGSDNFYFIYDKDYGLLSDIYDYLGTNITASFSYTTKVLSSPSGYWQSKEFYIYKWSNVDQIGPPSEIYQFKY
jgi:hypothetical protein